MDPFVLVFAACVASDADTIRCRTTPESRRTITRAAPRKILALWKYRVPNTIKIRLWGINAAERCEAGYEKGRQAMYRLVRRRQVVCRPPPGRKTYEWTFLRPVAQCHLKGGRDLAREIIRAGHARACRQHSGTYYDRRAKRCTYHKCKDRKPRVGWLTRLRRLIFRRRR